MEIAALYAKREGLSKFVNVEDGLKRIRNNKKLYLMIFKSFLAETHFDTLKEQIENKNFEEAVKTAHLIKGLVGNLSLDAAYEKCVFIESQLKGGEDVTQTLADMQEIFEETLQCIDIVLTHLDELEI